MAQKVPVGQSLPDRHERRTAAADAAFLAGHLQPGMSLLDCGCGPGTITIGLADWVAPGKVTGVDLDPKRVQQATATAESAGVANVAFQVGDVYRLPFPDASFDAAFMTNVLMHLSDRQLAVREVMRVLKPGGVFGAREMNVSAHIELNAPPEWTKAVPLIEAWLRDRGIDVYAGATLGALVRDVGFADVEQSASLSYSDTPEAKRSGREEQARRLETVVGDYAVEQGLADRAEVERMAKAIREWTHRDEFTATAHNEVVGWKPLDASQ